MKYVLLLLLTPCLAFGSELIRLKIVSDNMRKYSLILFAFLVNYSVLAQDELVNVFSTTLVFYDGPSIGGVARSECYTFVAQKNILLSFVYFEDEALGLKKGDTLIVKRTQYTPYSSPTKIDQRDEPIPLIAEDKFDASFYNNIYFVNISMEIIWTKAITYLYRGKSYAATTKDKFDVSYNHAAP
ncbi:MAG TPA: hypothetical protein EYN89_11765 [Flavobacteriales bacterium]|nr:hypothetical protein [Flavobacteriales bacterium]